MRHPFNWKKLSICSAIAYRRDAARSGLYFRAIARNYNDENLIDFLAQLKRHLHGARVILVWDGLPSHGSRKKSDYVNQQRA